MFLYKSEIDYRVMVDDESQREDKQFDSEHVPNPNDEILRAVSEKFGYVGMDGANTMVTCKEITQANVFSYVAAAVKHVPPKVWNVFGGRKLMLVAHEKVYSSWFAHFNFKKRNPVEVAQYYITGYVDEITTLNDVQWEALRLYLYEYYDMHDGNLNDEQTESL